MCCNESISREPCCGQVDGAAANNTSCRNVKPIRHRDNCALCLYNVQPTTQSLLLVYSQLQETRLYPKFCCRDVHFTAVRIQQLKSVNQYMYRVAQESSNRLVKCTVNSLYFLLLYDNILQIYWHQKASVTYAT